MRRARFRPTVFRESNAAAGFIRRVQDVLRIWRGSQPGIEAGHAAFLFDDVGIFSMLPEANALVEFMHSTEFKRLVDASTLGNSAPNVYLENRIVQAFQKGIAIGRQLEQARLHDRFKDVFFE